MLCSAENTWSHSAVHMLCIWPVLRLRHPTHVLVVSSFWLLTAPSLTTHTGLWSTHCTAKTSNSKHKYASEKRKSENPFVLICLTPLHKFECFSGFYPLVLSLSLKFLSSQYLLMFKRPEEKHTGIFSKTVSARQTGNLKKWNIDREQTLTQCSLNNELLLSHIVKTSHCLWHYKLNLSVAKEAIHMTL